jgi:hypothetical protein
MSQRDVSSVMSQDIGDVCPRIAHNCQHFADISIQHSSIAKLFVAIDAFDRPHRGSLDADMPSLRATNCSNAARVSSVSVFAFFAVRRAV